MDIFSICTTDQVDVKVPPAQFCIVVLLKYDKLKLSAIVHVVCVPVRECIISEASPVLLVSVADEIQLLSEKNFDADGDHKLSIFQPVPLTVA